MIGTGRRRQHRKSAMKLTATETGERKITGKYQGPFPKEQPKSQCGMVEKVLKCSPE